MQYDMTNDCMKLLKIAEECDEIICKYGKIIDKLWQPRILFYSNVGFLNYRLGILDDSLKFLYKSQQICQSIKDSGGIPDNDNLVPLNLITFLVL